MSENLIKESRKPIHMLIISHRYSIDILTFISSYANVCHMKLTGFQRFQLTRIWHDTKRDEFPDKETYIQTVCKAKGIAYTPPIDLESARNVTRSARMFPSRKNIVAS